MDRAYQIKGEPITILATYSDAETLQMIRGEKSETVLERSRRSPDLFPETLLRKLGLLPLELWEFLEDLRYSLFLTLGSEFKDHVKGAMQSYIGIIPRFIDWSESLANLANLTEDEWRALLRISQAAFMGTRFGWPLYRVYIFRSISDEGRVLLSVSSRATDWRATAYSVAKVIEAWMDYTGGAQCRTGQFFKEWVDWARCVGGLGEDVAETVSRILRKHRASTVIKRAWRKCNHDPGYAVCRKRLLREFEEEMEPVYRKRLRTEV